jgi:hypothetical protein
VTLAISLAIQSVLLTAWLVLRDPEVMRAILRAWRQSMAAGFLGAFASEMWFRRLPSRARRACARSGWSRFSSPA